METVLSMIINAENVRMLVLLAFGYGYLTRFRISFEKRIDNVETSIKELRSDMEAAIKDLKYNDFAHLKGTIEALTYALEKNGSLKREDKEYVDSRLAH